MPATPRPPLSRPRRACPGFTLIELAIVLVVGGLLIGLGISSWVGFRDSRRLALAASLEYQMKDCLTRRVLHSERYPTWSGAVACDTTLDVDACMCSNGSPILDPWGKPFLFLSGWDTTPTARGLGDVSSATSSQFVISDTARDQTRTAPAVSSNATDHTGAGRRDVAFILVSYGQDTLADSTSYGSRFGTNRAAALDPTARPDFQTGHKDDVYLIVTAGELTASLAH
jgi:prepilin-type N-terminal cleavage/methylation domain-containing protein